MSDVQVVALVAHEIMCAVLFYGCFVRAVRSSAEVVIFEVRLAFNLLACASIYGMAAPLWGYIPTSGDLLMLAAITYTQFITTRHWEIEVPVRFRKTPPRRRRTDFSDTQVGR